MSVQAKLKSLDKMVEEGLIIDAFDRYFDDKVVTHSQEGDRSDNKSQKRQWLEKFFSLIQKIDRIKLHGQTVTGNVTHSEFTFRFETTWGKTLEWHEVIRRTWKNGLVIDEYYFEGSLPKAPKKKAKKTASRKPAAKKAATKKPAAKKPATKTAPKKAAKTAPKKTVTQRKPRRPDDLKKIEGIGPKIAEILQNAGIKTFAKLAATTPARLKAILEKAGNRFRMHNPATWPKQARLAKDGKWDQLKKLQAKLKGGRE